MRDAPLQETTLRFAVSRTSGYGEGQPCPEAKPGPLVVWDRRTFKTPEEHDKRIGESWFARGAEHGLWYDSNGRLGGIQRRMPDREGWYVEFSTLAELVAFAVKYGELVIGSDPEQPSIEIYDDYRE